MKPISTSHQQTNVQNLKANLKPNPNIDHRLQALSPQVSHTFRMLHFSN